MKIIQRKNLIKYETTIYNAHHGLRFNYELFVEAASVILNIILKPKEKYYHEKLKRVARELFEATFIEDPDIINEIEPEKININNDEPKSTIKRSRKRTNKE